MTISPQKFSRGVFAALSDADRNARLRELESLLNQRLGDNTALSVFQEKLYALIEELVRLGHFLGRWEYDCEVEYWGGKSYMDSSLKDELLLRSEYPRGVRLAWGDYESLHQREV